MRYYCLVNPAARTGRGASIWQQAKDILEQAHADYRVYGTRPGRDAEEITRRLLQKEPGEVTIIALGGDGTVNELLQGIAAHGLEAFARVRLILLPGGSSNDLARALDYPADPMQPLHALLSYDSGQAGRLIERQIDIGELTYYDAADASYNGTKRYFVVSAGIGFDASVCAEAMHASLKRRLNRVGLGALAYGLLCVKQLFGAPPASCYVFLDGKRIRYAAKCLFVAVMNHKYQGGGVMFTPAAADDDGQLDFCFTDRMPKLRVLRTLPKAYHGKHTATKGICIDRSAKARIAYDMQLYVHTDGEVRTRAREIGVRCVPRVLRLMVLQDKKL